MPQSSAFRASIAADGKIEPANLCFDRRDRGEADAQRIHAESEEQRHSPRVARDTAANTRPSPVRVSARHAERDEAQHRRIQRIHLRRELRMAPIHRQRVLREVIGADGEKVRLPGKLRGEEGRRRDFHHDANRHERQSEPRGFLRQDRLRLAQLSQRGHHRKHDADLSECRGAKNGAKLGAQDLGVIQPDADAPFAQERDVFHGQRKIGQRLVPAGVQRANDQRAIRTKGFGDGFVRLELLLLRRRRGSFHEQELGPQQPDSFAAERFDPLRVLYRGDIGYNLEALSIQRHRRAPRVREIPLVFLFIDFLGVEDFVHLCQGGIEPERAAVPVQDHERVVGNLESPGIHAGQGWDAE